MAVAALIVAIVAALFTGWGVWFMRRQADATETQATASKTQADAAKLQATTDAHRLELERSPRFVAKVEPLNTVRWRLRLQLDSWHAVDTVRAIIQPRFRVNFSHSQDGVRTSHQLGLQEAHHGPLMHGQSARWMLDIDGSQPDTMDVQVIATDSHGSKWEQVIEDVALPEADPIRRFVSGHPPGPSDE